MPAHADNEQGSDPVPTSDFDELIADLAPPGGPGAAFAVQQAGAVIHAAGHGLANVEWGIPIDTETVFRIGSITKQFTAAAIMRLAEQGKVDLDDPIERHLPDYPVNGRLITVRHLLHHTSGIKSYTSLPHFFRDLSRTDMPLAQLIDVFKDLGPDFQPGERFLYNNSGYVLLGAIIEACSGKDYATFLADAFFKPLGMASTRYLHDEPIVPKRASGYAEPAGALSNAPPLSMSLPHAAGALGSTVGDLLTWDRALRGGSVVSPASYAAMTTPGRLNDGSPLTYGFGLATLNYRGHAGITHGGGINGFLSNLTHWPDADLTIVVLSNSGAFPIQRAFYGLARRAMDLPDLVRTPVKPSVPDLAAAAGVYALDIGPLTLEASKGALASAFPVPGSLYRPFGKGEFFLEADPEVALHLKDLVDGAYQRLVFDAYGDRVTGRRRTSPDQTPT
jgi:CubicO group peptidase (beta-lactamase class C family)